MERFNYSVTIYSYEDEVSYSVRQWKTEQGAKGFLRPHRQYVGRVPGPIAELIIAEVLSLIRDLEEA